jgi:membrane-anchored glycerophosphoryl diester phosphodiesterase (GDPDase)
MRVGEIFGEFNRAGTSIGIGFLSGLAIMVGYILLIVPGLYLTVALMYALPIGFDERRGVGESMRESIRRVHAQGFWPHAALALTLVVLGWALSALFDWVGSAISLAIALPVIACAYDRFVRTHTVPPMS